MGRGEVDGCCSNISKMILFIFNLIIFLAGAAILGLSIWMLVDKNFNQYLEIIKIDKNQNTIKIALYVLIGVGALIFIAGFSGCCGACKESTCLLSFYTALLSFLILLQIAAAVLAIVFQRQLGDSLRKSMKEQAEEKVQPLIRDEKKDALSVAWSFMQKNLKCCGGTKFIEYKMNNKFDCYNSSGVVNSKCPRPIPQTCCISKTTKPDDVDDDSRYNDCYTSFLNGTTSGKIHHQGCYTSFKSWIEKRAFILIGVGAGILLLQILCIIMACCLRSGIVKSNQVGY